MRHEVERSLYMPLIKYLPALDTDCRLRCECGSDDNCKRYITNYINRISSYTLCYLTSVNWDQMLSV